MLDRRRVHIVLAAALIVAWPISEGFRLGPPAAMAQGVPVTDPTNYAQLVQEAKNGLQEIKDLEKTYAEDVKTLEELYQFYELFAHATSVYQMAAILNTFYLKSPMLSTALQLEQAFRGFGLQTSLAGKISAVLVQLRYYAPSNTEFAGWHLNLRSTATSGQVASAQDAYDSATQRSLAITQMLSAVNNADPKEAADLAARGSLETATSTAQVQQLMAASLLQQAQKDAAQQQQEQAFRYSTDAALATAQRAEAAASAGEINLITQ